MNNLKFNKIRKNALILTMAALLCNMQSQAQIRYISDVYTNAQIQVDMGITFGTNINPLISNFAGSKVTADVVALKTAVGTGQPIPPAYYNPADTSTHLKVSDLKMDMYYPKAANDTSTRRPLFLYIHTGNLLPPCINGSPTGSRGDSAAVAACLAMARKGYVAITVDYRLGWNPAASTMQARRGGLLNAIFKAVHDVKKCIRVVKKEAAGANMYGVNPNQIVVYGEGTGAYISYSVATLDKFSELEITKFINPLTSKSYVDTLLWGNLDGFGGNLNLYLPNGFDAKINAAIGVGGAMLDTSWIDAGEPPLMNFKCVRDPISPFSEGFGMVPPPNTPELAVFGPNQFIDRANRLGNNDGFKSAQFLDGYSAAARYWYGKTIDYIFPAPEDKITITPKLENCFPFVMPLASDFSNQASPWQFWDPTGPTSTCIPSGQTKTAHELALVSNPGMGRTKGITYLDTITGYMCPRLACLFNYVCPDNVSVSNLSLSSSLKVYPNPASSFTVIKSEKASIHGIKLMDINGREIVQFNELNTYEFVLDMPALTKGIYFIQIETNQGFGVKKLMVD